MVKFFIRIKAYHSEFIERGRKMNIISVYNQLAFWALKIEYSGWFYFSVVFTVSIARHDYNILNLATNTSTNISQNRYHTGWPKSHFRLLVRRPVNDVLSGWAWERV